MHSRTKTLQYRLDKGTAAYSRLGSVLKGRHHLSVQQRVSLWQSCVWSTISYGLTTCGLTPAGHKSLETTVLRHLRAILRVPVHLTHTTNVDVARQAGVGLPYAILNRLLDAEKDRKQAFAWSDPLTYGPQSSWWQHLKKIVCSPSRIRATGCSRPYDQAIYMPYMWRLLCHSSGHACPYHQVALRPQG